MDVYDRIIFKIQNSVVITTNYNMEYMQIYHTHMNTRCTYTTYTHPQTHTHTYVCTYFYKCIHTNIFFMTLNKYTFDVIF